MYFVENGYCKHYLIPNHIVITASKSIIIMVKSLQPLKHLTITVLMMHLKQ